MMRRITALVCLAIFALSAPAASLGQVRLDSRLGRHRWRRGRHHRKRQRERPNLAQAVKQGARFVLEQLKCVRDGHEESPRESEEPLTNKRRAR